MISSAASRYFRAAVDIVGAAAGAVGDAVRAATRPGGHPSGMDGGAGDAGDMGEDSGDGAVVTDGSGDEAGGIAGKDIVEG